MTPDDLKKFYKAEIDIERLFAADPDNQGVLQTAYWLCGCVRALLTREEALRSQAAVAAVHAHIAASKWDRWLDPRQDLTRVVEMLDKMAGVPARGASGEQSVVKVDDLKLPSTVVCREEDKEAVLDQMKADAEETVNSMTAIKNAALDKKGNK